LLSNLYLNEVDKMLERAREVTRYRGFTVIEYLRFAHDLVVLVSAHPNQRWLHSAVEKRLREEFAKLEVEVNEQKSRRVDVKRAESFSFLGFDFWRVRSRAGHWMPLYRPQMKKRTALLHQLKVVFRSLKSQPVRRVISTIRSCEDGSTTRDRSRESMLLVYSQLGRAEDSEALGQSPAASRFRVEAVGSAVVV
jgi:RNA-directed DNA polymerase